MKQIKTAAPNTDLENLVDSVMEDIGAIFEVLASRLEADAAASSLCRTGGYLCDNWQTMIRQQLKELQESAAPDSRETRPRSHRKTGELLLSVNRPAA
ncbi:hypothetical protein FV139_01435 [Parahaliea maris]|uniref:Uncharacterized protein n=1 Tax=Parahaliea maris TaxID=2716870 RepID=A0A5C9A658_9GAMM|nr:hypothetical protein [Parahaliea maris]TXS96196.1 hypothetical protein FV139_01435 [Parahaliea maris]